MAQYSDCGTVQCKTAPAHSTGQAVLLVEMQELISRWYCCVKVWCNMIESSCST